MTREDPLLERYREASALDPARPSIDVRENVLARARAAAKAPPTEPRPVAANDAFWRWRAFGGLAVIGLATLVVLQFDRGTPEERDAVMSPAPPRASAPSSTPAPVAPPASSTRPIQPIQPTRPAPPAAKAVTPAAPEARTRSAEPVKPSPPPAPASPALRAPGAPAPAAVQDHNADAMAERAPLPRAQARSEAQGTLAREVDVNAIDAQGRTALMRAALRGDAARVRRLLEAGADPARRDAAGRNAAELAREAGHAEVQAILEAASAPPR
ncbi:hypothetical protein [Hydrogenophaga sp.]|uniref:ankyrin repeat domain-containing protein n=1 Tax=Hydrogenophaga sp. TaxID=1904254 RepID=UPI003F711ABF